MNAVQKPTEIANKKKTLLHSKYLNSDSNND